MSNTETQLVTFADDSDAEFFGFPTNSVFGVLGTKDGEWGPVHFVAPLVCEMVPGAKPSLDSNAGQWVGSELLTSFE